MTFEHFMMCVVAIAAACAAIGFVIFIGFFVCSEVREARLQRGSYKKIRHGHWINIKPNQRDLVKCSECGLFMDVGTNYCPKCGARMDKVE